MKFTSLVAILTLATSLWAQASNSLLTADRWKADLLLVVAHPDDESEIGAYLARAIFDEHKRVAVVFGTRGNGGGDQVGPQQAASLGVIREIEGRRALAFLGVTNVWFLDAPDTAGQNVLNSLETWDHGRSLGRLVRLVRLTRPSVIATWLPDYVAGENHGDHQAAGVIATEAFDIAGDPTQYPEQVAPPRDARDIGNLTEGLHPWQAQKLYYFSDTSHPEFLKGQGPQYSASDISPSRKESYAMLSARECAFHLTQSDSGYAAALGLQRNNLSGTYFTEPSRFIFGKSYVGGEETSDVFTDVKAKSIPYHPPTAFESSDSAEPSLALGGSWQFYPQFWKVHAIQHISKLVQPELLVGVNTFVSIPVLVHNPSASDLDGTLSVDLPSGWSLRTAASSFHVSAGDTFATTIVAVAPVKENESWESIQVSAKAGDRSLGSLRIRAAVSSSSLPQ